MSVAVYSVAEETLFALDEEEQTVAFIQPGEDEDENMVVVLTLQELSDALVLLKENLNAAGAISLENVRTNVH